MDAVGDEVLGNGVNGIRYTRILTGKNTGMALGVFFCDSLDAYFGGPSVVF